MDARIKGILCGSSKEQWTLICEDGRVKYYTCGEELYTEKLQRTGKGEAFAVITNEYCSSIPSVFTETYGLNDIPIEWTVVGVCSTVKATSRGKRIVSLPASVEYIAMEGEYGCYSFLFDIDKGNSHYRSNIDYKDYHTAYGTVYSKDGTELLCCEL